MVGYLLTVALLTHPPAPPPPRGDGRLVLGASLMGGSAVMLGIGADIVRVYPRGGCAEDSIWDRSTTLRASPAPPCAKLRDTGTIIIFAGTVVAATGAVLLGSGVMARRRHNRWVHETTLVPQMLRGGAGLSWSGRF